MDHTGALAEVKSALKVPLAAHRDDAGELTEAAITYRTPADFTLLEVGLGYLPLGQPLNTLSGGECQRIKLASELHKDGSIYVMDEPTTGLHKSDTVHLLQIINKLVDGGNTVIVIEHNMDVIKTADHIIDLGPKGGDEGGRVIATGTPEEVALEPESYTGNFLMEELVLD